VTVENRTMHDRHLSGIARLERCKLSEFFKDLFLCRLQDFAALNASSQPRGLPYQPVDVDFPQLNDDQRAAVSIALSQKFTMIQGPPGTGKTTTIAVLVYNIVQRLGASCKVLVCAATNAAVKFAAWRISALGVKVVRVANSASRRFASDDDPLLSTFGTGCDKAEEMSKIRSVNVICTTCGMMGSRRLVGKLRFDAVVIDEAGQCTDPDLLIAVTRKSIEMIVLVGDHKQLGPVVSFEAFRRGYSMPLLARLAINGVRPVVLRCQYRMHPCISRFLSLCFYDNRLRDLVSARERTWKPQLPFWPNNVCPVMYWNVADSEESLSSTGRSYVNMEEAACVAELLRIMTRDGVCKAQDIGVITPYEGQQTYLVTSLTQLIDELPEISSVSAFQGREKNFIICSCVRANDGGEIGFMKDLRQLCVSLSRARFGLIVIGNAQTFVGNLLWKRFIQYCVELKVFVEGPIDALRESSLEFVHETATEIRARPVSEANDTTVEENFV
jgi:regulator of nonsense transcripts 1